MRFSTYNYDEEEDGETLPAHSNMLVLFIDPNDPRLEEPMNVIFEEAFKLAADGANVHWFRTMPSRRVPSLAEKAVLRPNHLGKIRIHYGYERMYPLLQQFLTKSIYTNFLTCTAIIVELQEITAFLTNVECTTLLALMANTANWIAKRRLELGRLNDPTFPLVLLLRDFAPHRQLASLYTKHALAWRSPENWDDLFGWNMPLGRIVVVDEPSRQKK